MLLTHVTNTCGVCSNTSSNIYRSDSYTPVLYVCSNTSGNCLHGQPSTTRKALFGNFVCISVNFGPKSCNRLFLLGVTQLYLEIIHLQY